MVVQAILTVLVAVCTAQVASRDPASTGVVSGVQKIPTSPDVTGLVSSKFNQLFIAKFVVSATVSCPPIHDPELLDQLLMLLLHSQLKHSVPCAHA